MTSNERADYTHDQRFYPPVATFASPRRGKATALRRYDSDLDAHSHGAARVCQEIDREMLLGPTSSQLEISADGLALTLQA